MQQHTKRLTRIGDWLFETKVTRALKVPEYGQPYSGIATLTLNGDDMYIDGQMMLDGQDFSRQDLNAFYQYCQQLEVKKAHYDKMRDGVRHSRTIHIFDGLPAKAPILKVSD